MKKLLLVGILILGITVTSCVSLNPGHEKQKACELEAIAYGGHYIKSYPQHHYLIDLNTMEEIDDDDSRQRLVDLALAVAASKGFNIQECKNK